MAAKKKAIKAVKKTAAKAAPKKVIKGKAKPKTPAKKKVAVSNIGKSQLLHLRAILGVSISGMGTVIRSIGPEAGPSTKWAKYESGEEKIPVATLEALVEYAIKHHGAVPVFKNTTRSVNVAGVLSRKTLRSMKMVDGGYKVTCKFTPKAKRGTATKEIRTTFSVVKNEKTTNSQALDFVSSVCSNGG